MNVKRFLLSHPAILARVESMERAGLSVETITESVAAVLVVYLPSVHDREEVIRVLGRMLKKEGGVDGNVNNC